MNYAEIVEAIQYAHEQGQPIESIFAEGSIIFEALRDYFAAQKQRSAEAGRAGAVG